MLRVHVRWLGALGLVVSLLGWGCVPRAADNVPPPAPRSGQWDTPTQPRQARRAHKHHHHRAALRKREAPLPKEHCYFIIVVEGMT